MLHGRPTLHSGYGHTQGSRAVELRVPARAHALALVRSMTGSLADYEQLDGDTATDLALAVDEACTVLIGMAEPGSDLVLIEEPRVREVDVRVSAVCDRLHVAPGSVFLSGFSRRVLEALTEKVVTFVEETDYATNGSSQSIFGITLTMRRRWALSGG